MLSHYVTYYKLNLGLLSDRFYYCYCNQALDAKKIAIGCLPMAIDIYLISVFVLLLERERVTVHPPKCIDA